MSDFAQEAVRKGKVSTGVSCLNTTGKFVPFLHTHHLLVGDVFTPTPSSNKDKKVVRSQKVES